MLWNKNINGYEHYDRIKITNLIIPVLKIRKEDYFDYVKLILRGQFIKDSIEYLRDGYDMAVFFKNLDDIYMDIGICVIKYECDYPINNMFQTIVENYLNLKLFW